MKRLYRRIVLFVGCLAVGLLGGCAGPGGFSTGELPEKPSIDYAGVSYDDAWKDLVAFMEGDAKWCMGSIEDMSKADGYVRTSWRASSTMLPYRSRVMARFNAARDRVEFTPEAMFDDVPGYSTEVAEHLKVTFAAYRAKRVMKERPVARALPPESAADKEMVQRLVGTWTSVTSSRTLNRISGQAPEYATMSIEETVTYQSDGTFSSSVHSLVQPDRKMQWSSTGTWRVRNGELYGEEESVIAGNTSRANTHSQLLWRDGNSFERRAVPDAVTDAKTQKLGSTYTDTYADDGTRTSVYDTKGRHFESVSTPCIFKREEASNTK